MLKKELDSSRFGKENAQKEAELKKNRLAAEARENAKKSTQTLVAIVGSSICSLFFLGGFLAGGFIKIPLWNQEKNFTATGSFVVLLLICVYTAFLSSKDYILDMRWTPKIGPEAKR